MSRIRSRARKSRNFTVPDVTPSTTAVSAMFNSSISRSTSTSRYFSGSLSSASSICFQRCGRDLPPISKGDMTVLVGLLVWSRIQWLVLYLSLPMHSHASLVHGNPYQPSGKLGLSAKGFQMMERLQGRLLSHFCGICRILQNRQGSHIYSAFVGSDEFVKEFLLTGQNPIDKPHFVGRLRFPRDRLAGSS